MCSRSGCEHEARWYPVMLFYASRKQFPSAPPARAVAGLAVCDQHRETMTLDHLLTDDGWNRIVLGFRAVGKATPDRAATQLEFIPIDSAEAREFLRAQGH